MKNPGRYYIVEAGLIVNFPQVRVIHPEKGEMTIYASEAQCREAGACLYRYADIELGWDKNAIPFIVKVLGPSNEQG